MYKTFLFILSILSCSLNGYSNEVTSVNVSSFLSREITESKNSLADLDSVINESLKKFNVPGVAVGVIADNKVILSRGYGLCNVEKRAPVTEKTLFPIASCTKAFTALILAQLVEEKLISWDDLVITYIPEFRLLDERVATEITIRDLAAHRTGVPRHDAIWFCNTVAKSDVLSCLQYLEPVCGLREKWLYNNFMYSVLGILIERVTNQSWEDAVYSRIFLPLKMSNSNTSLDQLQKTVDFASPYAEVDDTLETLPFHSLGSMAPGGAINSNMLDMLKWVQVHLLAKDSSKKSFIKKECLDEMHAMQIPCNPNERAGLGLTQVGYGLGWFIGNYKDYCVISHGGGIDGFISEVLLLPEKNIGIVILTNSSSDGIYTCAAIRNTILDRLLGSCDTNWMEFIQKKRNEDKDLLHIYETQEYRIAPLPLQNYVGHYEHPAYGRVDISLDNMHLVATYGDMIIPISYRSENTFKGQLRKLLIFGFRRIVDFTFYNNALQRVNEVHISFEPEAKPIIFKRVS